MERINKIISTIAGFFSAITLIATFFWGKEFQNNSEYDFIIYYLSHVKLELFVLTLLFIAMYFHTQIIKSVSKFIGTIKTSSGFSYRVFLINTVIIGIVSIHVAKPLIKGRIVYHQNLAENFQLAQYNLAKNLEETGEIRKSIKQYTKLQKTYSTDDYNTVIFEEKLNILKARVTVSEQYYNDYIESVKKVRLTPINFNLLLQSFLLCPDNDIIKKELSIQCKYILATIQLSTTVYNNCRSNNDLELKQILNDHKGFFIENGIIPTQYLSSEYILAFKNLITQKDVNTYTQYLKKLWGIETISNLEVALNSNFAIASKSSDAKN